MAGPPVGLQHYSHVCTSTTSVPTTCTTCAQSQILSLSPAPIHSFHPAHLCPATASVPFNGVATTSAPVTCTCLHSMHWHCYGSALHSHQNTDGEARLAHLQYVDHQGTLTCLGKMLHERGVMMCSNVGFSDEASFAPVQSQSQGILTRLGKTLHE